MIHTAQLIAFKSLRYALQNKTNLHEPKVQKIDGKMGAKKCIHAKCCR